MRDHVNVPLAGVGRQAIGPFNCTWYLHSYGMKSSIRPGGRGRLDNVARIRILNPIRLLQACQATLDYQEPTNQGLTSVVPERIRLDGGLRDFVQ